MFTSELNYVSAALELFAAIITAGLILGCFFQRMHKVTVGKLLIALLTAHMLMLLTDAPIWVLLAAPSPRRVLPVKVLSFFSDAFVFATISLYAHCLTAYISEKKRISNGYAHTVTALCGAALFLCLLSQFNGMFIGYDETGREVYGSLYYLNQLFYFALPASTVLLALRHHQTLGWRDTWIFVLFGAIPVLSLPLQVFWPVTPVYLATTVSSFILVYTLVHIEQIQHSAEMEKKLIAQELTLAENRNALVLSQIQPHFLYNALTSIYRLCDVKPEAAKDAISDFAKYLRGNLDSISRTSLISFADELKHTQAYLSLEKIRYDDDLEIVYDIRTSEFLIPPLTVEPLAENAVNHGVSDLPGGGRVTIVSEEMPDHYEIRVIDNGVGFDPDLLPRDGRSHVGISAVRSRLRILCGGTLDIRSSPEAGTTATIHIPKGD